MIELLKYICALLPFALIIILFVIGFIFLFITWLIEKSNKKKYKISVINIITAEGNKKDDEILYSVKCEYENYRKARCPYLKSYELNGELVSELRRLKFKDYYKDELKNANTVADTIERIDKIWKDELTFTDEKMQKIFENIINLSHNAQTKKDAETVVNELKTGITSFNSFCDGRIYEMNSKLVDMEYKLQKRKINAFFTWIGWIVGIVSGLITIFS